MSDIKVIWNDAHAISLLLEDMPDSNMVHAIREHLVFIRTAADRIEKQNENLRFVNGILLRLLLEREEGEFVVPKREFEKALVRPSFSMQNNDDGSLTVRIEK